MEKVPEDPQEIRKIISSVVRNAARKCGSDPDVMLDDVSADIAIEMHGREVDCLKAFLRGVARNHCLKHIRSCVVRDKAKRKLDQSTMVSLLAPDEEMMRREEIDFLGRITPQIPSKFSDAIHKFFSKLGPMKPNEYPLKERGIAWIRAQARSEGMI